MEKLPKLNHLQILDGSNIYGFQCVASEKSRLLKQKQIKEKTGK